MGAIDTLPVDQQLEAIYLGYFGRAADGGGSGFWEGQYAMATTAGQSADQALTNIANSFEPQPETVALYPFLANPASVVDSQGSANITAEIVSLIDSIYQNLFGRTPPAGDVGVGYWLGQLQTGQVSLGQVILDIANGATGNDATVLQAKITAAYFFTAQTSAVGLGVTQPLSAAFLLAASTADSDVTSNGSVTASEAATTVLITPPVSTSTFTLTPNVDSGASFTATTAGVVFNGAGILDPSTGATAQTLTPGDSLTDTVGDGTLNATLTGVGAGAGGVMSNVQMTGIATVNIINQEGGVGGWSGAVNKGITAITLTGDGGLQLGAPGQGLSSAPTSVSVSNFTAPNGSFMAGLTIANAAAATTNALAFNISGNNGGALKGNADTLAWSNDGVVGAKTAPSLAYGTVTFNTTGSDFLQLSPNSSSTIGASNVSGTTTLVMTGTGAETFGEDLAGNFALVSTIDGSAMTGSLTITGASAAAVGLLPIAQENQLDTAVNGAASLGGSNAGLLAGNTALTLFKGSAGANFLDVSSDNTTQVAALTASGNTTSVNTLVVANVVADTTVAATFAGITGFQQLDISGVGGATGGGAINMALLPSTINDIFFVSETTAGALAITNQKAALTVDVESAGTAGDSLAVSGATGGSLTFIQGNAGQSLGDAFGTTTPFAISAAGDTSFTLTAQGGADSTGFIMLQPSVAPLFGNESVAIAGSQTEQIGTTGTGAIADLASLTGTVLLTNSMTITVTDTNAVTLVGDTTAATSLEFVATDDTVALGYSVNAATINAATSGGLIMLAGDANFTSTGGNGGDTITGSATAGNVLGGSIGNDTITGAKSATAADTIFTDGGADNILLAAGHTAADHIDLYAGDSGNNGGAPFVPGTDIAPIAGAITSATDAAQDGWWGLSIGAPAAGWNAGATAYAGIAAFSGTSADQSAVASFVAGSATAPQDVLAFSEQAWGSGGANGLGGTAHGLVSAGSFETTLNGGMPVVLQAIEPAATVAADANILELTTGTFANAAAVTAALSSGGYRINFTSGAATTAGDTFHVLFLYQDQFGNAHVMDLAVEDSKAFPASAVIASNSEELHFVGSDIVQLTGVGISALHAGNFELIGPALA